VWQPFTFDLIVGHGAVSWAVALTPGKQAGREGVFFMPEVLSPAQRRTLPARQALAAKFSSPEEKTSHFRALARRSHARRLTLSGDEAAILAQLSDLLRRIVDRDPQQHGPSEAREEAASVA
jgi:hypothetical protein